MLRWSVLRTGAGIRKFNTTGQLGDGREAAAVRYVLEHAREGDIDDVIATIDRFARRDRPSLKPGMKSSLSPHRSIFAR